MLVFVDESGKPHPNDSTTNPVLCCVCIKETDIKYISQSIFRLKMNIFGKDTEIKSTSLINRRVIVKNMTNNKQYLDEFVKAVCGFDINVFAVVMEKPDKPLIISENKLPKHYLLLIKRAEYFCENLNIEKAILVFDQSKTNDDLLIAKRIVKFLFMSKLGKEFNHVLEMPFFVDSQITPAIQIADIFAGIIRHYYENGLNQCVPGAITDPFELWIKHLFDQIKNKTLDLKQSSSNFTEIGFYYMGKKF